MSVTREVSLSGRVGGGSRSSYPGRVRSRVSLTDETIYVVPVKPLGVIYCPFSSYYIESGFIIFCGNRRLDLMALIQD